MELLNKYEVQLKEDQKEKDFKKRVLEDALGILEKIDSTRKNFLRNLS